MSRATHCLLIKTVSTKILVYILQLQVVKLPAETLADLKKLHWQFFWDDSIVQRCLHAIHWEGICSPVELGGLGIRHMRELNQACLGKLCWRAMVEKEKLWAHVLCSPILEPPKTSNCSHIWRSVAHEHGLVLDGTVWNSRVNQ